ncbi:MAG: histidine phosphatase family protein [gamma proteobacterium symbiont of Bathyaustriella thionipta]|nr:histidine phosphatase family protein [gamma proteobacterium symbiont of Bathyaustriella thionipta]
MPKLVAALMRHAEYRQKADTPSAHQPFPLTVNGQAQARQAAVTLSRLLQENSWQLYPAIDCSHMLRAWQTAQIICEELAPSCSASLHLAGFDALAERGLGSAANLSVAEIAAVVHEDARFADLPPDWKSNSHFRLPLQGAESLMQAGARVAAHLTQSMASLADQARQDTLKLFVGHGAAFRHAAHHLGVLGFEQIAQLSMYHAQAVFFQYQGKSDWRHIAGEWKVRARHSAYTD